MPEQGKLSPSQFAALVKEGRNKTDDNYILGKWPGQSSLTLANEIVASLMGMSKQEVRSPALSWGNEYEPYAIELYEQRMLYTVIRPESRLIHPKYSYISGEVDGLVGKDIIVEVKCPYNPANHVSNILFGAQLDKDYIYQANGYLWITGRKYLDFVSFHPEAPDGQMLYVKRIERNEGIIEELESKVPLFWKIVNDRYKIAMQYNLQV